MNRLLLLIVSIMLTSCGVKKSSVTPQISTTVAPALNEISTVEIGVSLVSKETSLTFDAIKITKEFNIKLNHKDETIEAGAIYIHDYTTKNMDLYSYGSDITFGIAIPKNSGNPMIYTANDTDGIYTTGFSADGLNMIKSNEKIEYVQTKVPAKGTEYFKQEFIYNGRVGDALKFTYREFINDYARPSFTQDVQYDVSESDTIGFRGVRLQIMNATNTTIEYKVLKHFDK